MASKITNHCYYWINPEILSEVVTDSNHGKRLFHQLDATHRCQFCQMVFRMRIGKTIHEKKFHKGEKPDLQRTKKLERYRKKLTSLSKKKLKKLRKKLKGKNGRRYKKAYDFCDDTSDSDLDEEDNFFIVSEDESEFGEEPESYDLVEESIKKSLLEVNDDDSSSSCDLIEEEIDTKKIKKKIKKSKKIREFNDDDSSSSCDLIEEEIDTKKKKKKKIKKSKKIEEEIDIHDKKKKKSKEISATYNSIEDSIKNVLNGGCHNESSNSISRPCLVHHEEEEQERRATKKKSKPNFIESDSSSLSDQEIQKRSNQDGEDDSLSEELVLIEEALTFKSSAQKKKEKVPNSIQHSSSNKPEDKKEEKRYQQPKVQSFDRDTWTFLQTLAKFQPEVIVTREEFGIASQDSGEETNDDEETEDIADSQIIEGNIQPKIPDRKEISIISIKRKRRTSDHLDNARKKYQREEEEKEIARNQNVFEINFKEMKKRIEKLNKSINQEEIVSPSPQEEFEKEEDDDDIIVIDEDEELSWSDL